MVIHEKSCPGFLLTESLLKMLGFNSSTKFSVGKTREDDTVGFYLRLGVFGIQKACIYLKIMVGGSNSFSPKF